MDRKEKICKAAIKIMSEKGYHNLRTQTIAEEADVAVGTIYHYFKSKEEITSYIFTNEYKKRIDFADKLEAGSMTPLEKFKTFWEYHIDLLKEDRDLAKIMIYEVILSQEDKGVIATMFELRDRLKVFLDEALLCGEIREGNTKAMVNISAFAMRGIVYSDRFNGSDEEYGSLKKEAIDYIIHALKK